MPCKYFRYNRGSRAKGGITYAHDSFTSTLRVEEEGLGTGHGCPRGPGTCTRTSFTRPNEATAVRLDGAPGPRR